MQLRALWGIVCIGVGVWSLLKSTVDKGNGTYSDQTWFAQLTGLHMPYWVFATGSVVIIILGLCLVFTGRGSSDTQDD